MCALLMTAVSLFMILLSLPVSLIFVVKVVQVRNDQSEAINDQSEVISDQSEASSQVM